MNGKEKKRKHFPGKPMPDNPMYDSLVGFWETSVDNDISDVLGSYTGKPQNGDEPEQDADDL